MIFEMSILESDSQIRALILEAMRGHMQQAINSSSKDTINEIKTIILDALKTEPEYESLKSGTLRYELGIPDPGVVDSIIDKMVNTLMLNSKPIGITNFGLTGGYELTMIKSDDINGILDSEEAVVNDATRGYTLPWLRWLLLEGNKPIVKSYEVKLTPSKSSRTGMAIMVESNKNWRVPAEFSGSIANNWTTRAIEKTEKSILEAIRLSVEKYI
jgi:hypothetical protein